MTDSSVVHIAFKEFVRELLFHQVDVTFTNFYWTTASGTLARPRAFANTCMDQGLMLGNVLRR